MNEENIQLEVISDEEIQLKSPKKINFKIIVVLIVAIGIIVGLMFALNPYFEKVKLYNKAQQYMQQQEYQDAQYIFEILDDFRDSKLMVVECKYKHALKIYQNGNYDQAINLFSTLSHSADAAIMIQECKYQKGLQYLNSENYAFARDVFDDLTDYKNGNELYCEAQYQIALQYLEEGDCRQANNCLELIGDYKDAESLIHHYHSKVLQEQSCEDSGVIEYFCADCGFSYTETKPATGHNWNEATCIKPKTCTICGKTEGKANGHYLGNSHHCAYCDYAIGCAELSFSVCGYTESTAEGEKYILTGIYVANNDTVTITSIYGLDFGFGEKDYLINIKPGEKIKVYEETMEYFGDFTFTYKSIGFEDNNRLYFSENHKQPLILEQ